MSTTEFLTAVQNCISLAKKYSDESVFGIGRCYVSYDDTLSSQLPVVKKLMERNGCVATITKSMIVIKHFDDS